MIILPMALYAAGVEGRASSNGAIEAVVLSNSDRMVANVPAGSGEGRWWSFIGMWAVGFRSTCTWERGVSRANGVFQVNWTLTLPGCTLRPDGMILEDRLMEACHGTAEHRRGHALVDSGE